MYISELIKPEQGTCIGPDIRFPAEISIDSRTLKKGQVFLALKGNNTDGHLYINMAIERGASGIIAQKGCIDLSFLPSRVSCVLVEDTSRFITELSLAYLDRVEPEELIAITGSVGKTTTRELTRSLLSTQFRVHGPVSSFNTRLGCALTVLAMPQDTQILVLEMGTNASGEIKEMAELFKPTSAVITDVREAHLSGLGNLEGVLLAKMEITSSPKLERFFYNSDSMELQKAQKSLPSDIKKVSVGLKNADVNIIQPLFSLNCENPVLDFTLQGEAFSLKMKSGLFGIHQARCLSMASAIAMEMGVEPDIIADRAFSLVSQRGRGRFYPLSGGGLLIDDSYNANPASMTAALSTVSDLEWNGRKIAILGSMKELGRSEVEKHMNMASRLGAFDLVAFVGSEWECLREVAKPDESHQIVFMEDAQEVLIYMLNMEHRKDLILVKGSNSNKLDLVVKKLVQRNET